MSFGSGYAIRRQVSKATVPKSSDVADPDPKELDENTGKGASQKLKMFFFKFRQLQYSIL